ncbi:hypothetical protein, partial [Bradyrhizobium sp.]|uniref:hypothetical protein n=1 Tax=Bradyrhizobium sp. TaxID=376 RepID=UPI00391BA3E7
AAAAPDQSRSLAALQRPVPRDVRSDAVLEAASRRRREDFMRLKLQCSNEHSIRGGPDDLPIAIFPAVSTGGTSLIIFSEAP